MTFYMVCLSCGHIESCADADDRPFECENCGDASNGLGCENIEKALQASESTIAEGRPA